MSAPEFNVETYLERRAGNPDFTMVEIGHGEFPIAYQQPFEFRGNRRYIGFESWLRDPIGALRENLEELHKEKGDGQNITYHYLDPGGVAQKRSRSGRSRYEGPYDPTTALPGEIADEVVLANTFSDEHVAGDRDRTLNLAAESNRLAKPSGEIVLWEIGTPGEIKYLSDQDLAEVGLKVDARVKRGDEDWDKLVPIYEGDTYGRAQDADSFCLFLSKIIPADPSQPDLGAAGVGQSGIILS